MGAALTAPLAALGSCLGTACAVGCCSVASAGSVDTNRGARCLLLWLQVTFISMAAWILMLDHQWLVSACEQIETWVATDVGICACQNATLLAPNETAVACRQNQMVLRSGFSTELVFVLMLILTASGCATAAARKLPVLKFLIIPVLLLITLFLPNEIFDAFGIFASGVSAFFSVAQLLIVINFAHMWNRAWFDWATADRRQNPGNGGSCNKWEVGLVLASVTFVGLGIALAVVLFTAYTDAVSRTIIGTALFFSLVTLVGSICECASQTGNLLVGSVVVLFSQWMVWQALPKMTAAPPSAPPVYLQLALALITLMVLICYDVPGSEAASPPSARIVELPAAKTDDKEKGETTKVELVTVSAPKGEIVTVDAWDFGVQCAVQSAAVAFFTYSLSPTIGELPFITQTVAVFLSLALYSWTLVAPHVLKNRDFS